MFSLFSIFILYCIWFTAGGVVSGGVLPHQLLVPGQLYPQDPLQQQQLHDSQLLQHQDQKLLQQQMSTDPQLLQQQLLMQQQQQQKMMGGGSLTSIPGMLSNSGRHTAKCFSIVWSTTYKPKSAQSYLTHAFLVAAVSVSASAYTNFGRMVTHAD